MEAKNPSIHNGPGSGCSGSQLEEVEEGERVRVVAGGGGGAWE